MVGNLKRGELRVMRSFLFIILFIFVIFVLFIIIKIILSGGIDNFLAGESRVDLRIESISESEEGVEILVKRRLGKGEFSGIEFYLSDGIEEKYFDLNTTLEETKTKKFFLNYSSIIKEISIAPIIKNEENKSIIARETQKLEFSNENIFSTFKNLTFWWKLDENAEDNKEGRNGILNEIDFVKGIKNKAADFDGKKSYIDLGVLNLKNSTTIEFWYNRDILDSSDSDYLIGNLEWNFFKSSRKGWVIKHPSNSNSLSFLLELTDGNNVKEVEVKSAPMELEKWNHVVCVLDFRKNLISIYTNGELSNSVDFPEGYSQIVESSSSLQLGSLGNKNHFDGKIDEVRIYNEILSDKKIRALYNLY